MEYISVEEFRKQPKEVQDMFIEYFLENKSTTDLVQVELYPIAQIRLYSEKLQESKLQFEFEKEFEFKGKKIIGKYEITPLLSEGQLRKFVEDKTGYMDICVLDIEEGNNTVHYEIECYKYENDGFGDSKLFKLWERDLLQAYWKVAIQIIKENK